MCDCTTLWIEDGQESYKPCHNPSLTDGTCYYHQRVIEGRLIPGDTYEDGYKNTRPISVIRRGEAVWTR